jgi:hypothetical protein
VEMASSQRYLRALVCVLFLSLISCTEEKAPIDTVKEYMTAVESFDLESVQSLVCEKQRAQVGESLSPYEDVAGLSEAFDMAFEDLEFTEKSNDGAIAVVQVTGSVRFAFLGTEDVQDVFEEHVLENVDGRWVICDP